MTRWMKALGCGLALVLVAGCTSPPAAVTDAQVEATMKQHGMKLLRAGGPASCGAEAYGRYIVAQRGFMRVVGTVCCHDRSVGLGEGIVVTACGLEVARQEPMPPAPAAPGGAS